jgi:hypothetical protein
MSELESAKKKLMELDDLLFKAQQSFAFAQAAFESKGWSGKWDKDSESRFMDELRECEDSVEKSRIKIFELLTRDNALLLAISKLIGHECESRSCGESQNETAPILKEILT